MDEWTNRWMDGWMNSQNQGSDNSLKVANLDGRQATRFGKFGIGLCRCEAQLGCGATSAAH